VNFGTGEAITINYIADKVKELSGADPEIVHTSDRMSQVPKLLCDYSLAKELFGWEPRIFIDEGIRRNIEWVKRQKGERSTVRP
jgi:nucleoside-diphosphate-sugar epimerase